MEGKPLKRSWARVSAVLWYLGLGLSVVVSGFFGGWLEQDLGLPGTGWPGVPAVENGEGPGAGSIERPTVPAAGMSCPLTTAPSMRRKLPWTGGRGSG